MVNSSLQTMSVAKSFYLIEANKSALALAPKLIYKPKIIRHWHSQFFGVSRSPNASAISLCHNHRPTGSTRLFLRRIALKINKTSSHWVGCSAVSCGSKPICRALSSNPLPPFLSRLGHTGNRARDFKMKAKQPDDQSVSMKEVFTTFQSLIKRRLKSHTA